MRKHRPIRTVLLLCLASLLMTVTTSTAYGRTNKTYGTTTCLTQDEFQQILKTLRVCGTKGVLFDTGLQTNVTKGIQIEKTFRRLFLGLDDFVVLYNDSGFSEGNIKMVHKTDQSISWDIDYTGIYDAGKSPSIIVGWFPDADPEECMRQHDEAWKILEERLKVLPTDDYEFYRAVAEWVDGLYAYDRECTEISHVPYFSLTTGKAVCDSYAKTLFALCFMSDRACLLVPSITEGGAHASNVVWYDKELREIDLTWADLGTQVDYSQVLRKLDIPWLSYLTGPYVTQ